jgi:DNA (cytosine-5)-methyltransferase 1
VNYYNEIDPFAAEWIRNLIKAGHIAPGDVDTRSIEDVTPADLRGYVQCHFFAGVGVWSYALRRAGWSDDRPVWTGSCPCQPFSSAGKGVGFDDERHLWPAFYHLISQCRPPVVFGEQVASKDGLAWLDLVQDDLEASKYAFGAADLCAAGVGAPHIRQRLYWVADAGSVQSKQPAREWARPHEAQSGWSSSELAGCSDFIGLADTDDERPQGRIRMPERAAERAVRQSGMDGRPSPTNGHWRDADWLFCRDGKWRPVEPSTFPLAHGPTARVGRLRAYGNAIVPQVAEAFIRAYLEC